MRTLRSIALMSAALLVPAGTAVAAPQPGALFGGGFLGTGDRGGQDADAQFLGARIDEANAGVLTFYADITLKCGKNGTTLSSVQVEGVQVAADGTFGGTTEYAGGGDLGTEGGPVEFTGRFVSDTRIEGTVTASSTVRLTGKDPYSCASGVVRYAMADNANDPGPAPRRAGGRYVGTTGQDFSALLRLSANGKGFAKAAVQGNMTCKAAADGVFSFEIMPGKLIAFGKGGRFRGVERFTSRRAYITPARSRLTWVLTGRFADGKLTGIWKGTLRAFDPDDPKKLVDTCTARIPFRAVLV